MSVLVAKEAPDFVAPAVMPSGMIEDNFKLSSMSLAMNGRLRLNIDPAALRSELASLFVIQPKKKAA